MDRLRGLLTFCALLVFLLNAALAAEPGTSEPIELPQADRSVLERLLGPGVVGAALPGKPLPVSSRFLPVEDATWVFRFASGEQKGATEQAILTPSPQDTSRKSGQFAVGGKTIFYFRQSDGGDLYIVTEHDLKEGMITRFAPSEPVILSGMTPGSSKRTTANVKVYDLSDPNEVTHQGMVALTYSYVGTYKVTVPAGTFDAALIKWHYNGEVGPASVKDTQYQFFAEGVGPIATVDKTNISAFLVYQNHTKLGKVLVEKK